MSVTLPVFVTVIVKVSPGEPLALSSETVTPSDVTVSVPETDPVIDESLIDWAKTVKG